MNVPSGYTALDLVGFTDKGPYNSATAYVKNDIAHYGGNLWRCLVDDTTNVTPTEGANWTVFLAEPTSAAEDIIAPVEASAVSTRQYAVGKQLILNDTLYRVTAAVNIGDTLVVDTNIALSDTVVEQLATKANTSSLATVATSGSYTDLSNQPPLGTAAAKDVPTSGNASTTEVVMGDDTRLSDARNAADVYSWAKASTKPTYNGSEINTSAAQTGTAQSAVAATIASGTSMDAAVEDLLDNDVTLASEIASVNEALSNEVETQGKMGVYNVLSGFDNFTAVVSADSFIISKTSITSIPSGKYKFQFKFTSAGAFIVRFFNGSTVVQEINQAMVDGINIADCNFSDSVDGILLYSNAAGTASEIMVYPNIYTSTTYTPYAMTNRELTESVSTIASNVSAFYTLDIPYNSSHDGDVLWLLQDAVNNNRFQHMKPFIGSITPGSIGFISGYMYYGPGGTWYGQIIVVVSGFLRVYQCSNSTVTASSITVSV